MAPFAEAVLRQPRSRPLLRATARLLKCAGLSWNMSSRSLSALGPGYLTGTPVHALLFGHCSMSATHIYTLPTSLVPAEVLHCVRDSLGLLLGVNSCTVFHAPFLSMCSAAFPTHAIPIRAASTSCELKVGMAGRRAQQWVWYSSGMLETELTHLAERFLTVHRPDGARPPAILCSQPRENWSFHHARMMCS